jgi:TPR repeat protein
MKSLLCVGDGHFLYARRFLNDAGFDLETSGSEARNWCLGRADQGDTQAQYVSAELLSTGLFGPMDKNEALTLCKSAAAAKFAPALLLLASFHEAGWGGLTPNLDEATKLMDQAASMGYGPAMSALGHLYLANDDSPKHRELAMRNLRQAADLDDPGAQATLGRLLIESGTPTEIHEGLGLLHRAAEQDLGHAHRMLGYYYKGGQFGLPRDETKADHHFSRADELE